MSGGKVSGGKMSGGKVSYIPGNCSDFYLRLIMFIANR